MTDFTSALLCRSIAVVGVMCSATAASALIVAPFCATAAGMDYRNVEQLSGGLTLYSISVSNLLGVNIVRLTHCEAGSEVMIEISDAGDAGQVRSTIYQMVADEQTYTFDDIANRFSSTPYQSNVQTIQPDGCICAFEG